MQILSPRQFIVVILHAVTGFFLLTGTIHAEVERGDSCDRADWFLEEALANLNDNAAKSGKILDKLLQLCPEQDLASYYMALAQYRLGNLGNSLRQLQRLEQSTPSIQLHARKMMAYILIMHKKDIAAGKKLVDEIIGQSPDDGDAKALWLEAISPEEIVIPKGNPLPEFALIDDSKPDVVIQAGVVLDAKNHLMWQQDALKRGNLDSARRYCDKLSLASYRDWRLPTVEEFSTLVDEHKPIQRSRPQFDTASFPRNRAVRYWAFTPGQSIDMFGVETGDSYAYNMERRRKELSGEGFFYIWCVRDAT